MAVCFEHAHAILHLRGNVVRAENQPLVAQTAGLALNNKAPKRVAGVPHQLLPAGMHWRFYLRTAIAVQIRAVVARQRCQCGFERVTEPAERRRLFLDDFVVERALAPVI